MSNQEIPIPWEILTNCLKLKWKKTLPHGPTANYYLEHCPPNIEAIKDFSVSFVKAINLDSDRLFQRVVYNPVEPEDVVIGRDVMRRIKPTLSKLYAEKTCTRSGKPKSKCSCEKNHPIFTWPEGPEDTQMSFWLHGDRHWIDDGERPTRAVLLKTLLVNNEMDTFYQIATHPAVEARFSGYIGEYIHNRSIFGNITRMALEAYICLNVLYLAQIASSSPSSKQTVGSNSTSKAPSQQVSGGDLEWQQRTSCPPDYRLTKAYQTMLVDCTQREPCAVETHLHRQFFGVPRGVYKGETWYPGQVSGTWQLESHLRDLPYMPRESDITVVISHLGKMGLPMELSLMVLEYAEYEPSRRLRITGDPLHPENLLELTQYMSECWDLLVRVDVVKNTLGFEVDWLDEIGGCIDRLFMDMGMEPYDYRVDLLYLDSFSVAV